jgi:4-hydroxy-3-methylbut-2-enyl diphosphate reductase
MGMCFGVRDAIELVEQRSQSERVTVLGELVHNETVLANLRARGIAMETSPHRVTTPTAVITAHGASDKFLGRAREQGLNVIEATCPLVHVAHQALKSLIRQGYHPIIIGIRGHVEVRGMTEDLTEFDVVLNEPDVRSLRERPRFGIVAQTTQPIDRVHELVSRIQARFPNSDVRFADTVCQPTKQRQTAAIELARQCDLVVVVGGAQSNNTRELADTCRRFCARVVHVQGANEVQPGWLNGVETVGITAGTSTPDEVIDSVEQRVCELSRSLSGGDDGQSVQTDPIPPVPARTVRG